MLFVVFFTTFLTAGNIIKTCCRLLCAGIVAVTRTVSAKLIVLIYVFIFVETTLAVEALALAWLSLTVPVKVSTLAVEALALAWLSLTVSIKVSALAVEALALARLSLTVPVKVSTLAIEGLALTLLPLTVPVKVSTLTVETLALLPLTVEITVLVRIGPVIVALHIPRTVLHVPVLAGIQIAVSIILSCSGGPVCCFYRGRAALYRSIGSSIPVKYILVIRRIAVLVLAIRICCGTLRCSRILA
jgi:hypothetical protein